MLVGKLWYFQLQLLNAREDEHNLRKAFRKLYGEIAPRIVNGRRHMVAIDDDAEIFCKKPASRRKQGGFN